MTWPTLCLTCLTCWGAPNWPEGGEPHEQWVASALQWRSWVGVEECVERTAAIDALTLRWIAESATVTIRVETASWPELQVEPSLARPLVQMLALEALRHPGDAPKVRRVQRRLQRVARRSPDLWSDPLAEAFAQHRKQLPRQGKDSDDNAADRAGEHQQGEGS